MKNKYAKYGSILYLILGLSTIVNATIYQKTDDAGKISFSDSPTKGAVLLKLKLANTYSPETVSPKSSDETKNQPKPVAATEKKFFIAQPINQQNFQNESEVQAMVNTDFALRPGDNIEWWLDEKLYQQTTSSQIVLSALERGEHRLQAKLLDAKNHILLTTQPIVFYLHFSAIGDAR